MSFLVVLQLWMHAQMSWLSNKPGLSVKAKQKRMCHFKVTNQSDERISWISVASVLIRCLKAPQLAICCIKAGKCSTTKQRKKQTLKLVTGVDKRLRAQLTSTTESLHHKTQGTTIAGVSHADVSLCKHAQTLYRTWQRTRTTFQGPHLRTD